MIANIVLLLLCLLMMQSLFCFVVNAENRDSGSIRGQDDVIVHAAIQQKIDKLNANEFQYQSNLRRQLLNTCLNHKILGSEGDAGQTTFGFRVVFRTESELLIGAPMADDGKGRVYTYTLDDLEWTESVMDSAPNEENPSDIGRFGYDISTSADGNLVAIGQPGDNGSKGTVWWKDFSSSSFSTYQKLAAPTSSLLFFGYSLAIQTNVLLVAALEVGNVMDGTVVAFVRSGAEQPFVQTQAITQPGGRVPFAYFGFSIALYPFGLGAVISAPGSDSNAGQVFRFTSLDNGETWTYDNEITSPNPGANQRFGFDVAVSASGNQLFVGSPGLEDDTNDLVYTEGTTRTTTVNTPGVGYAIAVDDEGYSMVIGLPNADLDQSGAAERMYFEPSDVLDRRAFDVSPSEAGKRAGYSVGISSSGDHIAVGVPLAESDDTGAVHVAFCKSGPTGTPTSTPSQAPSLSPTTSRPSASPTMSSPSTSPSTSPTTSRPSNAPSRAPSTPMPTTSPTPPTSVPTASPSSSSSDAAWIGKRPQANIFILIALLSVFVAIY